MRLLLFISILSDEDRLEIKSFFSEGHLFLKLSNELEISNLEFNFKNINRITLVACGTAFLACNVAKYWFEKIARIPVELDVASEFRYREPPVEKNSLAIFVSQSGETADTLAALRYCNQNEMKTLGIVNVNESTISREASMALQIHAGPEIGVASTKAFTCQLTILYFLAIKAAKEKGLIKIKNFTKNLLEYLKWQFQKFLCKN